MYELSDVFLMIKILESLNSTISLNKDFVKLKHLVQMFQHIIRFSKKMRASFLILGPLLTEW